MEPVHTCKLFGAIKAIMGIKNAIPLIHGPAGCTYHIKYLLGVRSGSEIRICCSELTQEDVVFGAEEKLSKTIMEVDKTYSPELIFVLSSCSTSLIGEDIFRIARESKQNINAEIIAISAGGFEGDQTEGYKEVMLALIKWSLSKMDSSKKTHTPRLGRSLKEKSLNLIGLFRGGPDLLNLKDTFKKMGVHLNCVLTASATMEDISLLSHVKLNYSMCDVSGIEPSMALKENFGTEFLHYPFPLGFSNSKHFFQNIIDHLDLPYSLKDEEKKYNSFKDKYTSKLQNYKVAIISGPTRAVALCDFVLEMGMMPVLISMDIMGEYTKENIDKTLSKPDFHNMLNESTPKLLEAPDFSQIRKLIKSTSPDLIVGGMGEVGLSREFEIPLLDVMHAQEVTLGWDGAVKTAENICNVLDLNRK